MGQKKDIKLSPSQQVVLDKMKRGWELGCSHTFGISCWLLKGEIGEGGQSEDVRYSTLEVLFKKGLIDQKGRKHGIMWFKLTQKARSRL